MPSCPGGPPCHAGSGSDEMNTRMIQTATTGEVTYSDLIRTISSTDFADIFILDSKKKLIMSYNRSMVVNSAPATYQYILGDEDKKVLRGHIGKKIYIQNKEHTTPKLSTIKSYKLVL